MQNLLPRLLNHLDWHISRIKCLHEIIFGLIRCKSPHYSDIADYISGDAKSESKIKRIYRIIKQQNFDATQFAQLLSEFCPPGKWLLTLDRTNWQCGKLQINILALCVNIGSVSIPILINLLPKDGASNAQERMEILQKFIEIFGVEKIGALLADREFWDEKFVSYLHQSKIPFVIRLKANLSLKHHNGGYMRCDKLMANQKCTETSWRGLTIKVCAKKERDLYVASFMVTNALDLYKKRWAIETSFKAFKSQGFYLERTQIEDIVSIRKLVLMISLAMSVAIVVGLVAEKNDMIRVIKANGSKMYTLFKIGLKTITSWLVHRPKSLAHIFSTFQEGICSKI